MAMETSRHRPWPMRMAPGRFFEAEMGKRSLDDQSIDDENPAKSPWFSALNHTINSGWWFEPLWKIWKSIGMIRNPIYGKIKNGNQTTNQKMVDSLIRVCSHLWHSHWIRLFKSCWHNPLHGAEIELAIWLKYQWVNAESCKEHIKVKIRNLLLGKKQINKLMV